MISLVIADDHPVVRYGLRLLFDQEPDLDVIGEADDGPEAVELVRTLDPDVLILDVAMPTLSGIDVVGKIRQTQSRTRIVILSMYASKAYLAGALKNRVDSYALKSEAATTLVQVVRDTVAGKRYLSPELVEYTMDALAGSRSSSLSVFDDVGLTPRETAVVRMVAQGHTNTSIASQLGISQRTVESHRANVMRKLGIDCQADLVRFAIQSGIAQ